MDDVDNLIIPDDLQLVLMECQPALEFLKTIAIK
jgi:hypothetical protein